MIFQFNTFNITAIGRLAMQDILSNIGRQMEALGHEMFWSDDGFAQGDDTYVILCEGFFDNHLEVMREAKVAGVKFIIFATETPSALGFNAGLTEEMRVRQRTFGEAAKCAVAIWYSSVGSGEWYAKFGLPVAHIELGYAPNSVRHPQNVLDHDFGFFGSLTKRRHAILRRVAREKIGDHRALVRYTQFESVEMRDAQMVRCRVILQIRPHEAMGRVSTSRCCTALHIGRPVIAEHHSHPGVWGEIIEFAHHDIFIQRAIRMHGRWEVAYAEQFARFKELLSPEKCVGLTIKETFERAAV